MSTLAKGLEADANLIARFQALVSEWRREVAWTSSASEMAMHPAYQQIIGKGQVAVPLLLRELEQRPDHWFWALRAITGVDPVPGDHRGKLPEMAKAWLEWGRQHGYAW